MCAVGPSEKHQLIDFVSSLLAEASAAGRLLRKVKRHTRDGGNTVFVVFVLNDDKSIRFDLPKRKASLNGFFDHLGLFSFFGFGFQLEPSSTCKTRASE